MNLDHKLIKVKDKYSTYRINPDHICYMYANADGSTGIKFVSSSMSGITIHFDMETLMSILAKSLDAEGNEYPF